MDSRLITAALATLVAVACDDPAPPAPPAEPVVEDTPSEPTEPDTDDSEPAPLPEAASEPELTTAQSATFRRDLQRARELSHSGGAEEALAIFESLVELTPTAPRLLCEAGYVAHLADDERRAEALLDRGLTLFALTGGPNDAVAMCWFNRGLVHDARGFVGLARQAYEQSLELRDNAGVERRLEAAREAEARDDRVPPLAFESVEDFLEWQRTPVRGNTASGEYTAEVHTRFEEAAIVATSRPDSPSRIVQHYFLIPFDGGVRPFPISYGYERGGTHEDHLSLDAVEITRLTVGNDHYWRLEATKTRASTAHSAPQPPADAEGEQPFCFSDRSTRTTERLLLLCESSGRSCRRLQMGNAVRAQRSRGCADASGNPVEPAPAPPWLQAVDAYWTRWLEESSPNFQMQLTVEGDQTTIALTDGELGDAWMRGFGAHPNRYLGTRALPELLEMMRPQSPVYGEVPE